MNWKTCFLPLLLAAVMLGSVTAFADGEPVTPETTEPTEIASRETEGSWDGDTYTDNYTEVNGHKFGEIVIEPTCTHRGYTIHYCEDCGYEYSDSYVPATGHAYEAEEHPVTCTENA